MFFRVILALYVHGGFFFFLRDTLNSPAKNSSNLSLCVLFHRIQKDPPTYDGPGTFSAFPSLESTKSTNDIPLSLYRTFYSAWSIRAMRATLTHLVLDGVAPSVRTHVVEGAGGRVSTFGVHSRCLFSTRAIGCGVSVTSKRK